MLNLVSFILICVPLLIPVILKLFSDTPQKYSTTLLPLVT